MGKITDQVEATFAAMQKQIDKLKAERDAALANLKNEKEATEEMLKPVLKRAKEWEQLKEENERLKIRDKQNFEMIEPIIEWGQNPESGLEVGDSITREVLKRAKERDSLKQLNSELVEALDEMVLRYCYGGHGDSEDRGRATDKAKQMLFKAKAQIQGNKEESH